MRDETDDEYTERVLKEQVIAEKERIKKEKRIKKLRKELQELENSK